MENNSSKHYKLTRKNGKVETYDENAPLPFSVIQKLTGISAGKLRYAKSKDKIDINTEGVAKISIKNALAYQEQKNREKNIGKDICFNINESFKFLPSFPRTHYVMNPRKFRGNTVYAVGNNGTIININRVQEVQSHKTGNGHLQVRLDGIFKSVQPTIQQLVALMWCCNAKDKKIVHHIDCVKTNNNYKNLIYVTDVQHKKAHSMIDIIKECREKGNKKCEAAAITEYLEYIKTIEVENYEPVVDLRIIPHLDYKNSKNLDYYMYVTEESYQLYLQTNNESDLVIKGEGAF
jgi:hypothetical protein